MSDLATASLLASAASIASGYRPPPMRMANPDNQGPGKKRKKRRKMQKASRRKNRKKR